MPDVPADSRARRYAQQLARTLADAAGADRTASLVAAPAATTFDVAVVDADDLPAGYSARVTIVVDELAPEPMDYTAFAGAAVLAAAAAEHDFGGWLAEVLEGVARDLGGSEALVAGRPGSWEAEHVRRLAAGADR